METPTQSSFSPNPSAYDSDLKRFTQEPHPFGSSAQERMAQWLMGRLREMGKTGVLQPFKAEVPNPHMESNSMAPLTLTKTGHNIYVLSGVAKDPTCRVWLGSHYDTKHLEGESFVGANDGGSSTVLLLQLLQALVQSKDAFPCDVGFVWFDGEESILYPWEDGEKIHPARIKDNTYGSRFFADSLERCAGGNWCLKGDSVPFSGLILVDMVGSPNIVLTRDTNSTPSLWELAQKGAKNLGMTGILSTNAIDIEDDHIPFLAKGIPSLDVIDFTHMEHWHKPTDTLDHLDITSMTQVGRLVFWMLQNWTHP